MIQATAGQERREYRRFELPDGRLHAQIGGEGFDISSAPVRDISRGGVKLQLGQSFGNDDGVEHCVVRFIGRDSSVRPATARGKIRRIGGGQRDYYVAIEFAEPLESIALPTD